jgi:hypothetical protein
LAKGSEAMVRTNGLRVAVAFLLAVLPSAHAGAEKDDFATRFKQAELNIQPERSHEFYHGPFSKDFYQQYPAWLSQCMKETTGSEVAAFDIVIKLAANGEAETVMARPQTALASCFVKLVKARRFPAPPSAHFWLPVGIKFAKQ